ncbi:MAG: DNA-primase RepB domain-containing protein [Solirubrobacteraceae bacterium]
MTNNGNHHTPPMAQALAMIAALRAAMPAGAGLEIGLLPYVGTERQGALQRLPLPPDADPEPLLRQARGAQMRVNAQVLIRPDPAHAHPWLLIDDLPEVRALALAARRACIVVRTSPGNTQVRLLADKPLTQQERRECQDALVLRLIGGDDNSRAGDKWGRLPGFTNRKPDPGKTGTWTELLADTSTVNEPARSAVLLAEAEAITTARATTIAATLSPRPRAGGSPLPCSCSGFVDADPALGWTDRWAASLKFACASLRRNKLSDDQIIDDMAAWLLAQGKRKTESACKDLAIHLFKQAAAMQPRGAPRPS